MEDMKFKGLPGIWSQVDEAYVNDRMYYLMQCDVEHAYLICDEYGVVCFMLGGDSSDWLNMI